MAAHRNVVLPHIGLGPQRYLKRKVFLNYNCTDRDCVSRITLAKGQKLNKLYCLLQKTEHSMGAADITQNALSFFPPKVLNKTLNVHLHQKQ